MCRSEGRLSGCSNRRAPGWSEGICWAPEVSQVAVSQGYGDRSRPGAIGVQPEAGLPAGDVRAANCPARRERGDAGQQGRGRDCLGAEDHRVAGAAGGGVDAQIPGRREEGIPRFPHGGGDDGEHRDG
jgi:hypothetical protein